MVDAICLAVALFACGFASGALGSYAWFKRALGKVERAMSESVRQCEKDMLAICAELVDDVTAILEGKGFYDEQGDDLAHMDGVLMRFANHSHDRDFLPDNLGHEQPGASKRGPAYTVLPHDVHRDSYNNRLRDDY